MKVSVVVITRDAEFYIKDLLDSLVAQASKPYEIIVTDAESRDKTMDIVKEYVKKHDFIRLYTKPGTRAVGRNFGVSKTNGDIVAFIDADCIANAFWVSEIEKSMENVDVVAGKTIKFGFGGFANLPRVGIKYEDVDVTYPSCNLAYKKDAFERIEGFDPWFKEAEEIDLNYRAVATGCTLMYNENAVVYHRARETFIGFLKQSFWYGFGRKELTLKHGSIWSKYSPIEMVRVSKTESIWKLIRLGIAFFGYMFCKLVGRKQQLKERLRKSKISGRE